MSYPPEDIHSSDDSERWDAGAPLNSEQTDNIVNAVMLWVPDAEFRVAPATQFDEERNNIEEKENVAWNKALDQYERDSLSPNKMPTVLGKTPLVLRKCSTANLTIRNLPIKTSKGVLTKITQKKHKVPVDELRKLPAEISDPLAVFVSKREDINSIVVLTEIKDLEKGYNSIVAINLDAKDSGGHEINFISSIHGRQPYQIGNFINNGLMLYVNKKKSRAYLQSCGLQLPTEALKRGKILTEEDVAMDVALIGNSVKGNFRENFQQVRWIKQSNNVFGWFNPNTSEIVMREGYNATTVMKAIWHITLHFAKMKSPGLHSKMEVYAQESMGNIKPNAARKIHTLEVQLEEVGAESFSKNYSHRLKRVLKNSNDSSLPTGERCVPKEKNVNFDRLIELKPKEAMASLVKAFVRGKFLGCISPEC